MDAPRGRTAAPDLRITALALAIAAPAAAVRIAGVLAGHGFWNDEAWVAIATRVHAVSDFLLALSVTPVAWGALLRPLAALPVPPELSLRLLPLAAGLASLAFAWRLGGRLAGAAGGLAALALVGADATSVGLSTQLKPYTAEAALALLAFLAADDVVRGGGRRGVARLALVLALGTPFSNAQMLVAPAILATLGVRAWLRRELADLGALVVATALVGLFDVAWLVLVVRPWLTPALHQYFRGFYVPTSDARAALTFLHGALTQILVSGLGRRGFWIALAGLVVLLATPARWMACAVLLLVAELVAASAAGMVPMGVLRTGLFLSTLLLVTSGAALGCVLAALWTRKATRIPAALVALAVALLVAASHPPVRSQIPLGEDLGPLVRRVERERRPGDRIVLYERSVFVWGYYQARTPVLTPVPALANGYTVAVTDPDVVVVRGDAQAPIAPAFAGATRVWFLGSRFRSGDEQALRNALGRRGRVVTEERRPFALLLLLEPR